MDNHYEKPKPKPLTKHPPTDTKIKRLKAARHKVAGYPGLGGRMLLEWVAGYSGICSRVKPCRHKSSHQRSKAFSVFTSRQAGC